MKHWYTTKHFLGQGTITACRNLPIAANDSFTDLPEEVSCPHCLRHIPAHRAPTKVSKAP